MLVVETLPSLHCDSQTLPAIWHKYDWECTYPWM